MDIPHFTPDESLEQIAQHLYEPDSNPDLEMYMAVL